MARYAGIRSKERRKLDRSVEVAGDLGLQAPVRFFPRAQDALKEAIRRLTDISNGMDGRTHESKQLLSVIGRLKILQREIRRYSTRPRSKLKSSAT